MKRILFASIAALVLLGGVNVASAQTPNLGQPPARPRPIVSPYINLGQGGNAGAFYGIIRPQIDANRSINELQQGLHQWNQDGTGRQLGVQPSANGLGGLQTGHSSTFFNTGNYFSGSSNTGGSTTNNGVNSMGGFSPSTGSHSGLGGHSFYGSNLAAPLVRPN